MFAEFRAQYPTGALVSQMLEFTQGQYVVSVAVQLEGEILATGMAAATTLEEAEDRGLLELEMDDKSGGYKSWYSIKWGVLRIGCEVRSLGDWIANAEEIDRKHGDGIADQTQALAERLAASTNEEE